MRRKRKESEARQAMRSEGSEQVCLLADYLELRKIKRHTHIQCYLLSLFFLFHSHIEEIGVLQGVIPGILFGVRRNCLGREKLEEKQESQNNREWKVSFPYLKQNIRTGKKTWINKG